MKAKCGKHLDQGAEYKCNLRLSITSIFLTISHVENKRSKDESLQLPSHSHDLTRMKEKCGKHLGPGPEYKRGLRLSITSIFLTISHVEYKRSKDGSLQLSSHSHDLASHTTYVVCLCVNFIYVKWGQRYQYFLNLSYLGIKCIYHQKKAIFFTKEPIFLKEILEPGALCWYFFKPFISGKKMYLSSTKNLFFSQNYQYFYRKHWSPVPSAGVLTFIKKKFNFILSKNMFS